MKSIEILADYFTSQKLSAIHNQIDSIIRIALLSDPDESETFTEFAAGLHEVIDAAFLLAGK
jgi:hypothetical protein